MLEGLQIHSCPILESLPEGMMQKNTILQRLEIISCGSLWSLPRAINLMKKLLVYSYEKLELSLDDQDMTHNLYVSLTSLKIIGHFLSLMSFPLAFFPKLEHLFINSCRNLESLYIPDGLHHTSLRIIAIYSCPNLVSFPQGGLPLPI